MNTENLSDRRRRTRSTLVEAGVSVFAVKGIEGASIEEICEAGGLTRGAFYSNFSSRDDLVLATIEIRTAETLDRLDATIQRWKEQLDDTDAGEIRPLLTQFIEEIFTEKLLTAADAIAEQEITLYCLRVPELYARYQELDARRLERLARLVQTAIDNVHAVPTVPLDSLLTILISLFTHLSLESAAGRELHETVDIDPSLIVEVLLRFLDFDGRECPRARDPAAKVEGVTELQREYTAFINNMDVRLGAFVLADLPESVEQEDGTQAPFRKDLSPESLPLIEHFVLSRFATPDEVVAPENHRFVEGLIRYLGETYLRAVGGAWDHDETTGNGMPFIRPDNAQGQLEGEPIPLVAVVLTAVDQRTGGIFTAVLNRAQQELGEAQPRTSTGLSIGMLTRQNSTEEEVEFLSRFIGTIEPGIAAWTKEQADPESWALDRDSLVRLGKQLAVRYDTRDEMMADDEVAFVAGAMRFIGETIRRIGLGQWRYGADLEADDPRSKQPYIRFVIGDQNLDLVPWKLAQAALEDSEAIAKGHDTVIEMREEEAAGASSSSADKGAPADKDAASER